MLKQTMTPPQCAPAGTVAPANVTPMPGFQMQAARILTKSVASLVEQAGMCERVLTDVQCTKEAVAQALTELERLSGQHTSDPVAIDSIVTRMIALRDLVTTTNRAQSAILSHLSGRLEFSLRETARYGDFLNALAQQTGEGAGIARSVEEVTGNYAALVQHLADLPQYVGAEEVSPVATGTPFDLSKLVREVVAQYQSGEKGMPKVSALNFEDAVPVVTDRGWLVCMLDNIVHNLLLHACGEDYVSLKLEHVDDAFVDMQISTSVTSKPPGAPSTPLPFFGTYDPLFEALLNCSTLGMSIAHEILAVNDGSLKRLHAGVEAPVLQVSLARSKICSAHK